MRLLLNLLPKTLLVLCALGSTVYGYPPKKDPSKPRTNVDPPFKYFHESSFSPHYDGRFAAKPLAYDDQRFHLRSLIQTYLSTMNDIGAETWLMHGSLLGWFWNRRIMPWDSDLDVMVSEKSMAHLANYYNMTVHHFVLPEIEQGRDYLLEINPHWTNGSVNDNMNVIDARWVDMETGLFIDITTLRSNLTAQAEEGHEGYMMVKDRHHYNFSDIFPLRESLFEDTPVYIPYAYTDVLAEEYTPDALVDLDHESHHFDQQTMEWKPLSPQFGGPNDVEKHSKIVGFKQGLAKDASSRHKNSQDVPADDAAADAAGRSAAKGKPAAGRHGPGKMG